MLQNIYTYHSMYTFIFRRNSCIPICAGNCSNNGLCISPHTCQCYFGYAGKDYLYALYVVKMDDASR